MDRCDECGYDYGSVARAALSGVLRALAGDYRRILETVPAPSLRAHPAPGTWSALEYSCHYRDVLRAQRQRVLLARTEDRPTFASMRREERVLEEDYNGQAPPAVAVELTGAAEALSTLLGGLDETGWARTGIYNWPERAERSVEWIGRHTVHEGVHHLLDIERLTEQVDQTRTGRPGRPGATGG